MAERYYDERRMGPNGPVPVNDARYYEEDRIRMEERMREERDRNERVRDERVREDRVRINDRPRLVDPIVTPDVDVLQRSTVKWRAIFAGAFVSIMTYLILMSLGLAIGGGNLQGVIQGEDTAQALGIGAGVWLVASIVISLFIGAFAAGRVSGLITNRVGRTQGVVISALFFGLLLSQVGSAIGSLGRGIGATVGAVGTAAGDLSKNPQVQDLADDVIGDLNLRSSPEVVVSGLTRRLVRGDTDGAANYLSRQAGITREEADARLQTLKTDIQQTANDAGQAAARGMRTAGYTLFGSLLLGMLAAILGGGAGAAASLRSPLSRADRTALRKAHAA